MIGPVTLGKMPGLYDFACGALRRMQDSGLVPRDRFALSRDAGAYAVLEGESFVAVAVFYEIDATRVWLDMLFVEPEHRRKGYASALLRRLALLSAEAGRGKLMLGTAIDNEAMKRLAAVHGFLSDHVVMTKLITPQPRGRTLAEQAIAQSIAEDGAPHERRG